MGTRILGLVTAVVIVGGSVFIGIRDYRHPPVRMASVADQNATTNASANENGDAGFLYLDAPYGTVRPHERREFEVAVPNTDSLSLMHSITTAVITFVRPDGQAVTAENANQLGYQFDESDFARVIEVGQVQAGTWKVQVDGAELTEPADFEVAMPVASDISLDLASDKDAYQPGEVVTISGKAAQGAKPMTGLTWKVRLTMPDETSTEVALHDDGKNGDDVANDGAYAARYTSIQSGLHMLEGTAFLPAGVKGIVASTFDVAAS